MVMGLSNPFPKNMSHIISHGLSHDKELGTLIDESLKRIEASPQMK
jgi:hypothetical protein